MTTKPPVAARGSQVSPLPTVTPRELATPIVEACRAWLYRAKAKFADDVPEEKFDLTGAIVAAIEARDATRDATRDAAHEAEMAALRAEHNALTDIWAEAEKELRADLVTIRAALATAERERDAYRKAKDENDERFMIERDEARAALGRLEAERVRLVEFIKGELHLGMEEVLHRGEATRDASLLLDRAQKAEAALGRAREGLQAVVDWLPLFPAPPTPSAARAASAPLGPSLALLSHPYLEPQWRRSSDGRDGATAARIRLGGNPPLRRSSARPSVHGQAATRAGPRRPLRLPSQGCRSNTRDDEGALMATKEALKAGAAMERARSALVRVLPAWPQRGQAFDEINRLVRAAIRVGEVRERNRKSRTGSPMMCEHANEVPASCPCRKGCYCKTNTCSRDPKERTR